MDKIYKYNQKRWNQLNKAHALFTRPKLNMTKESAKQYLDPCNHFGNLSGKSVLCLASGGGQQSVAFALLGANITVFDISNYQLEKDQNTAESYKLNISTIQGDMRDLSSLYSKKFDIVYQPYSINFIPDCFVVFKEVSKVIKDNGIYFFMCANPFFMGVTEQNYINEGILIKRKYTEGEKISYPDQDWVIPEDLKGKIKVDPPIEYRHTLGIIINNLNEADFIITHLEEYISKDNHSKNGSWECITQIAPPWLSFWTRKN